MHFVESSLATSFFTDQDELQTFLDCSFSQPSTPGEMLTILLRKGKLPGWTSTPLLVLSIRGCKKV